MYKGDEIIASVKSQIIIKSFLTAEALTVSFVLTKAEKITDLVYDILGSYSFIAIVLFVVLIVFYIFMSKGEREGKQFIGLSMVFSASLLVGKSFTDTNSFVYCFGSVSNFVIFIISLAGYTCLFMELIPLFINGYKNLNASQKVFNLSFNNSFVIIMTFWLPAILLSSPGNLCYDVLGEIGMAMGDVSITSHHPLLHILLVGFFIKIGELIGSISIGLFIYILFQSIMLALALAGTIAWLKKEKACSDTMLLVILGIYCISPMYSNMASTAIKDVPFMAAVIWYVVLLAEMAFHKERIKDKKFVAIFIVVSILTCLLRNNGLYMVALSGVVITVSWWRNADRAVRIRLALALIVLPIVFSKFVDGGLMVATKADKGSAIEALSVPLQQSARYLQLYKDELTDEEIKVYNNTFVDYREAAAAYDPDLADPVKTFAYYGEEKGTLSLSSYLTIWFKDFFKHPVVYFEAFFAHIYGWFDPAIANAPRYEVEESVFGTGLSIPQKIVLFYYRFAERITPLNMLQNVGIYTWLLFILLRILKDENRCIRCLTAPLVVSLLICMASPCFYGHPRYAFPYMFTLPFYYGFALKKDKE
ncbi:hypothetical protein SAMN02910368_01899 [Lachnospiraceae bacterium G11]|nr:hypothetical protein SAMN02910368_01899 [Lachnospiraceae bacterium G11]